MRNNLGQLRPIQNDASSCQTRPDLVVLEADMRIVRAGIFFLGLSFAGPMLHAQSYRGEAVPVVERANPVEFSRLRFLTLTFGHEGPMDAPLRTPPVMGRGYFVEADVFGLESAASVRFELADANGRSLQTITMWKTSDSSSDGEFNGFFKVPDQPFRAVVTGTTTRGVAFRSSLNTLFQPSPTGPAEQLALPPGTPPNQMAQIESMVAAYRQELHTRAAQAAAEHPDGTITIARAVVSPITYEPLNSVSGAPIGMRLRYSIRFTSRQTVAAVPLVFPVYQQPEWRGVVEMKPLAGTITPAPQN